MKLYNFKRLIQKYSVPFVIETEQAGRYESGKWVEDGIVSREATGAIVPLAERKVYSSGGHYTSKDRSLYSVTRIEDFDKSKVVYKGNVYKVEEETDYSDYADAYVYVLKWVSACDRPQK